MASKKTADNTIEALLTKLLLAGSSVNEDNLNLEVLIENLPKITGSFEEKLDKITSVDKTLGKVISAIKRIGKRRDEIKQILGIASSPKTTPGFGALSSEEAYEKSGWRTINGANVWTRPANISGITEHFPPSATRFAADYQEVAIPEYNQATALVTSEQAAQMRKEDAEAEAIKKSKMTEYERFIYENKDTLGEKGADAKFRQMLLKQLPPFFKDSKLSTKSLIDIGKLIKSAKGIPLVGKLMHPASLGFAALGMMDAYLGASSSANRSITGWSGSRMLTGSPSEQFQKAARLAGAKDEQEVLKLYSELLEKFGREEVFSGIGTSIKTAPPGVARLATAKGMGLNEKQANLLMFLAGQQPLESTKEAQETEARESRLRDIQKWGLRSGSSAVEKVRGASLWLLGEKELEARGTSWLDLLEMAMPHMWGDLISRKAFGSPVDAIDEGIKRQMESEEAAKSYDSYESNGGQTSNNTQNNIRSANIYIQNMDVTSNNPDEFSKGLVEISENAPGGNRALLASFGSGFTV